MSVLSWAADATNLFFSEMKSMRVKKRRGRTGHNNNNNFTMFISHSKKSSRKALQISQAEANMKSIFASSYLWVNGNVIYA